MGIKTVLIADDEEDVLRMMKRRLSSPSLRVTTVGGGAEALAAARNQRPDIIILDYFMPQLDGFETCRALRDDARTRDIPVLMLSGMGSNSDAFTETESGPDAFLGKPFDWDDLLGWMNVLMLRGRRKSSASECPASPGT
ncbi:MAG: response regulator [Elusimicrobiota bacterium]|jgi:DNA-binding response OmpR family regulator